jgi:hypothetical protein
MRKGQPVRVVNPELQVCGQIGVIKQVLRGFLLKYIVTMKGKNYLFFESDIVRLKSRGQKGCVRSMRPAITPGADEVRWLPSAVPALPIMEVV